MELQEKLQQREYLTTQLRRLNERINESFALFIKLATTIIGGAFYLHWKLGPPEVSLRTSLAFAVDYLLISPGPASSRYVDDLVIGSHAFDFIIGVRPRRIRGGNLYVICDGLSPELLYLGDRFVDIVDLKPQMVDADLARVSVSLGMASEDGKIDVAVGEINPIAAQADLLQVEGLTVESRGFFRILGSYCNVLYFGHGFPSCRDIRLRCARNSI